MPGRGSGDRSPAAAARQVVSAASRWRAIHPRLVIAIDGHGAAGKSTIADLVAQATGAALVRTDDFFLPTAATASGADLHLAAGTAPGGVPGPAAAVAAIGRYYDWARLRAEAIDPLLAGRAASFRRFDWEHGGASDSGASDSGAAADRGAGVDDLVTVQPSSLIVVEGVSSGAPALADLVHRSVFVDTPAGERMRRLRGRVAPGEWDDNWLAAEQAYFTLVRPAWSFDLVVAGAGAADGGAVTCKADTHGSSGRPG